MDLADVPRHRPLAFDKMEALIKEMQDPETGVPVRSQKIFLSLIPSAFMGYDLVEWLMDRFNLDEASNVEAINLGNQLCQHGYFFPVNDLKNLVLKDDSSLYRFQSPYYWPWTGSRAGAALGPDNVEYAIYLVKRTLRNKQRHALDDYEQEALANLRRNLAAKWDFITMQAEEQVRLAKDRKKGDKIVSDSQERAYWRVARPPPGVASALEPCPVPVRARQPKPRKRTMQQLQLEIDLLKESLERTRVKASVALEALVTYSETFAPYDPWLTQPQPSNPWVSDDTLFWQINSPLVEVPSEKRVQRWALSIEELVADPTGLQEFTSFLRKEYSHENIRFWLAVMDLRRSSAKSIPGKLQQIYEEFLKPGAPCEINIDGATAEKVAEGIKTGSRYALDHAADHVYNLLLKKDCYPRFVRSDHFQRLLADGRNVHQKKKFFNFGGGGQVKKKPEPPKAGPAGLTRRRGSERSLSGSAHELAVCAAQPPRPAQPPSHSHSQSNLADSRDPTEESGDEVAPWEACGRETGARRRQDSAAESSSSSDVSERRRLPQQTTLDGGLRGAPPPLRRLSAVEPRHLPPPASPPRPIQHTPTPAPPHPTPTISVSSAPDDDSSTALEEQDPPSVFPTPTSDIDKTICDITSESEPIAGCSRDDRTMDRELETSPAYKCRIGDLPGSHEGTVVVDRDLCHPGPSEEADNANIKTYADSATKQATVSVPVLVKQPSTTSPPKDMETSSTSVTQKTPDVAKTDMATRKAYLETEITDALPSVPVVASKPYLETEITDVPPSVPLVASKPYLETEITDVPSVSVVASTSCVVSVKLETVPSVTNVETVTSPDKVSVTTSVASTLNAPAITDAKPSTSNVESASMTVKADSKPKVSKTPAAVKPDTAAGVLKASKAPLELSVAPLAETEDLSDERIPSAPSTPRKLEPQDIKHEAQVAKSDIEPQVTKQEVDPQIASQEDLVAKQEDLVAKQEEAHVTKRDSHEEQKRNDVCPWEDENACESDAPFVKTYATLGYL